MLPGRRHLLFDHRRHGQSDQPEGRMAHRLDEYIADVLAGLDAAEVEHATLVGYSDGAQTAPLIADFLGRRVPVGPD